MRIVYFFTTMLGALSMSMAFSHLLQMPVRMDLDSQAWLLTQQLFPLYGSIGAFLEVGAVLLAILLAFMSRRLAHFPYTVAAAFGLAMALGIWLAFVAPANAQISQWTADTAPADWTQWRTQWEYAHAVRAFLLIAGVGSLVAGATARKAAFQA